MRKEQKISIEEEIKILENALSGALLLPSECAFVNTEIIKICLETLKTYESWELLIKHEITEQVRANAIDDYHKEMLDIIEGNEEFTDWQKYEILQCNDLVKENLKEQENEMQTQK